MVQRPPLELICEKQNMKGHEMKTLATTAALALALTAQAEFKIDRAAMSEKYWNIWNDEVQAKIDADIEANRKADAVGWYMICFVFILLFLLSRNYSIFLGQIYEKNFDYLDLTVEMLHFRMRIR